MSTNEIPLLTAEDIECRVQSVKKTQKGDVGATLLIYKDARVDMRILDHVYGPNNWQRTHEVIDGTLYCNIDIWDSEKQCWVRKQDAGTESNTEKEKGRASDAFKRSGFNVGIGRELYTAPFIWIKLNSDEHFTDNRGNIKLSFGLKFSVDEIEYDDERRISKLSIIDNKGRVRFSYQKKQSKGNQKPREQKQQGGNNNPPPTQETPPEQAQGGHEPIICDDCGFEITPALSKNGRPWSPAEIAELGVKKHGRPLCADCQAALRGER